MVVASHVDWNLFYVRRSASEPDKVPTCGGLPQAGMSTARGGVGGSVSGSESESGMGLRPHMTRLEREREREC